MKKLLGVLLMVVVAFAGYQRLDTRVSAPELPPSGLRLDAAADDTQVHGSGIVTRILPDDEQGSRHQRFILRLPSGQTLLIAHNIDLAPRVSDLEVGDRVEYRGEYQSNPKGGVVHWTHRDPAGRHAAGWLRHDGQTFQ
ncbi:DUF3465 domain-containing protein [Frateuria soli]|uniref:DUF3465 domain-containing protein n=1 Tax=Frateuria soli TaxID=1542730 RepID=UPI001E5EF65B|nr:DUF3465 domain-containing protein [Frateuria soli]UGB37674.1 DUF3465 domain-containing protein [Frateuria soli]